MTAGLTAVAAPTLTLSSDMKVSPLVGRAASKMQVRVLNAFGLPAGSSCPGMTTQCAEVCYASALEAFRPNIRNALERNFEALKACGNNVAAIVDLLEPMVSSSVRQCERRGVAKVFRIHWDGDFYSLAYAKAWRQVIALHPDVKFWAYTRSFTRPNVVPILADLDNLALYLSVDVDNLRAARRVTQRHDVRVAAMGRTAEECAAILSRLARGRAPLCPEVVGRMPLVVSMDRRRGLDVGEEGQGACVACGLCIEGRADVRFPTNHKA